MIIAEINDRCNTAFKTYQMIVYMKWVYIKDTTKNEIISPKNSKSKQVWHPGTQSFAHLQQFHGIACDSVLPDYGSYWKRVVI